MLAGCPAEGAHDWHIGDHIDHFAIDRRRLVGEVAVQRRPRRRPAKHHDDDDAGDQHQTPCHAQIDRRQKGDGAQGRGARREDIPRHHVFDLEHGVGRGRDAAGQRAGQTVGEIGRGVTGEMAKKLRSQIPRDRDES